MARRQGGRPGSGPVAVPAWGGTPASRGPASPRRRLSTLAGDARALSALAGDPRALSALAGDARALSSALAGDARALFTPSGVRGVLVESLWISAHMAIYPWGLLRERHEPSERYALEGLGPTERGLAVRDVEAAGTPILLVHGMVDNRAIFTVLKRRLRKRGFGRVLTLNYSPVTNDIRQAARDLAVEVEAVVAETGFERIHVVGHSLGGLIARYYVQRLGGDERVHTLVTLGSPHEGTMTAHLLPVHLCRQLRPASDLFTELASPATCRTRFVAYWSDLDQLIIPHESGRLDHPDLSARNVRVHGVGHMSLPLDGQVVHEISGLLSELDWDGTTLRAGVTPLLEQPTAPPKRRTRRTTPA